MEEWVNCSQMIVMCVVPLELDIFGARVTTPNKQDCMRQVRTRSLFISSCVIDHISFGKDKEGSRTLRMFASCRILMFFVLTVTMKGFQMSYSLGGGTGSGEFFQLKLSTNNCKDLVHGFLVG